MFTRYIAGRGTLDRRGRFTGSERCPSWRGTGRGKIRVPFDRALGIVTGWSGAIPRTGSFNAGWLRAQSC
jgi:hypothetical protein